MRWLMVAVLAAGLTARDGVPQADRTVNPVAGDAAAIDAGRRTYESTCIACHGAAGAGESGRGSALNAGRFVHGDQDADLFHSIRNGIRGTAMAPFTALTDQQVWQLVAYIRSLNNAPRVSSGDGRNGNPANGEALFFGTAACASCHEVNGRGAIVGPDLSAAARLGRPALRQKIVDPNAPGADAAVSRRRDAAAPLTVIARTADGREIRGVRLNEDTFSLQMVDASGGLHLLDKQTLADVRYDEASIMPADYTQRLSERDIDDLVAYLSTLNERDLTKTATAAPVAGGVTYQRLVKSADEPHNWLMYWGDYRGTHYSPLKEITASNVGRLQAAWAFPLTGDAILEATPVVVDGVMYTTGGGSPAQVVALDARTGRQLWTWTRQQKARNPYEANRFNRGVAILGQRLFVGTLDASLVALDARTGRPLWEVQVADTMEGYSITSPPLVVKDKLIVGISGGEYGTRGFVDAYDAATGTRLWRFYTVPGPGEFGNETWKGDSWQRGASAAWLTGSYDPELNTVYWTVGNPAPQIDRSARGDLDNLFSCSVIALDPDTGRRKWHFQFTPNDGHDWDSVQDVILVDRPWRGQMRKLLLHADRNAFLYVLDRVTGEFLRATPFAYQNWNQGFDAKGRPIIVPGSNSSADARMLVYPTLVGGTNFQAPSYNPVNGWLYLQYAEGGELYASGPVEFERGRQYIGRARERRATPDRRADDPAASAGVKAIDPETGKTMWDTKIFEGSLANGVLATGGGVLFGAIRDGNFVAWNAATGAPLWRFQTGGTVAASPISYAVGGRQFVAISAGNAVYAFALPSASEGSANR
jgi:alcohol dehydrogenase (cytochrome c)